MTALGRRPGSSDGLRDRRNRRRELSEAAIHVFYVKTFAGASMQDIADAIGVLKGSVYHYVDSKEELLAEVFERGHVEFEARRAELDAFAGTPQERLRRFVEGEVCWYLGHHELAAVLVRESSYLTGDLKHQAAMRHQAYLDLLSALVLACRPAGSGDRSSVDHAVQYVRGAIHASPEWHARSGFRRPAVAARAYAELVVRAACSNPH